MKKIFCLLILLINLGACTTLTNYESPKYDIVLQDGDFSVRRYPDMLMASASGSGENSAFRKLFRYISGQNDREESISMTVPVRKEAGEEESLSFFMPSSFSLAELPAPADETVEIKKLPARLYGVLSFSGVTGKEKVNKKFGTLEKWIQSKGYSISEKKYLDRFDPPWTPWFLKKNEILVAIDE